VFDGHEEDSMTLQQFLNTIGLVLGMLGVVLLFWS
jgi:hypothetical protein